MHDGRLVVLAIVAFGVVGAALPTSSGSTSMAIAIAVWVLGGASLAVLFFRVWSTTQNRIAFWTDHLLFTPALRNRKPVKVAYADVERLVFNDVVIRLIWSNERTLTFQPYRLHSEDLFEFLPERIRETNPDCIIQDRSPRTG